MCGKMSGCHLGQGKGTRVRTPEQCMSTSTSFQPVIPTFETKVKRMNPAALEEFRAGVTGCLRSWSALRTAVESGWGGGTRESQAKAESLRQYIFDTMNGSQCPLPNLDLQDLADGLAIYLEEEFSVTLEDNSERQVAEVLLQMYQDCFRGDCTLARKMVENASKAVEFSAQFQQPVQTTEHDDDDDSEMGDHDTISSPGNNPTAAAVPQLHMQPLFGEARKAPAPTGPVRQLGEAVPEDAPLEMDDDGFAPVKPKGRRKR